MTREEAIQVLTDIKRIRSDEIADAIDMAIEALQADTVSRDDFDALKSSFERQAKLLKEEHGKAIGKDRPQGEWLKVDNLTKEQTHGKWLLRDGYYCSNCHHKLQTTAIPDYCPNCGADMRTDNKLPGYDEIMDRLDNLKLEFTIHGTERVKRMVGDDHE